MKHFIWLVGAGPMAIEYAKVLVSQGIDFITIGRGESNSTTFSQKTGQKVISGGLEKHISSNPMVPEKAIIATGVDTLSSVTRMLLEYGIKEILCEKPGGLDLDQLKRCAELSKQNSAKLLIAYNRRFYSSVVRTKEIIKEDGGVSSFNFEFTEWSHLLANNDNPEAVMRKWFLSNSSHVVDLAYYLGGKPKEISCYTSGGLSWHKSSSIFSGAGISEKNALFSYRANWGAPGRWGVEVLTNKHRLVLSPMEKLQIQKIGSLALDFVEIDNRLDIEYKPGLYNMIKGFIGNNHTDMCYYEDQLNLYEVYQKMANYK